MTVAKAVENPEMDVTLMFPSLYLRAAEFAGKEVTLTVHRVRPESMRMNDNTKREKFIVEFEETDKMLVLNKTNANAIAKALGIKKAVQWAGHKITLYPTECDAFGDTVECIRVKGAK